MAGVHNPRILHGRPELFKQKNLWRRPRAGSAIGRRDVVPFLGSFKWSGCGSAELSRLSEGNTKDPIASLLLLARQAGSATLGILPSRPYRVMLAKFLTFLLALLIELPRMCLSFQRRVQIGFRGQDQHEGLACLRSARPGYRSPGSYLQSISSHLSAPCSVFAFSFSSSIILKSSGRSVAFGLRSERVYFNLFSLLSHSFRHLRTLNSCHTAGSVLLSSIVSLWGLHGLSPLQKWTSLECCWPGVKIINLNPFRQ